MAALHDPLVQDPCLSGSRQERQEQFFAFQLKTSRNIDSDWPGVMEGCEIRVRYDHWFHGGLECRP